MVVIIAILVASRDAIDSYCRFQSGDIAYDAKAWGSEEHHVILTPAGKSVVALYYACFWKASAFIVTNRYYILVSTCNLYCDNLHDIYYYYNITIYDHCILNNNHYHCSLRLWGFGYFMVFPTFWFPLDVTDQGETISNVMDGLKQLEEKFEANDSSK